MGFLAWVIPFSFSLPFGKPVSAAVLPLYVTPHLYLTDLAVIFVLVGGWVGLRNSLSISPLHLFRQVSWISFPLVALVVMAGLGIPFARSPTLAAYTTLRWLFSVIFFFSLSYLNFSTSTFVLLLVTGLGMQVLVGIGQVLHQGPLGLPGELALEITQPRAAIIRLENASFLRAYGFTFHPNVLGGLLCAGLLLSLPLLKHEWMRLIWWLLVLGLILTFSRSAWLTTALILPLSIAWLWVRFPELRGPFLWTFLPAFFVCLVAVIILFGNIAARLSPFQSFSEFSSLVGRGQLIAISLDIMRTNPFTGIGAGNFPLVMLDYQTLDPAHYVHNVPLLLASEVGLLGGLLWYWLWFIPVSKVRIYWMSRSPWLFTMVMTWFAWGLLGLWDFYPWALEAGRLFSMVLLTLTVREVILAAHPNPSKLKGVVPSE